MAEHAKDFTRARTAGALYCGQVQNMTMMLVKMHDTRKA